MSTEAQNMNTTMTPAVPPKKKKRFGWLKVLLILAILAGGICFALFSCASKAVQSAVFYQAEEVAVRDLEVIVSDSGTVEPADSYSITALVTGEVLSADFNEGDWVEKDDLLYSIDAGDLDNQIEQAQLSLKQAQLQYDTVAKNMSPVTTAPGRVKEVFVEVGDSVAPGAPIAALANGDDVTITLPFHSADAALLSVGQSATLTLEGNMEQLTGTITNIGWDNVAGAGGTVLRMVEISLANPGGLGTTTSATATVGMVGSTTSATFQTAKTRTVYAATNGTITSVLVNEGDWVETNTKLCTIGGSTAETTLSTTALSVDAARLALSSVMDMLENYEITAPISGTVIDKEYKVGDNVEAGGFSPVAVIYDMSYLTFTLNIDELDVNKLKVGQSVRITAEAVGDQQFMGTIDKISINGTTMNGVTTYPVTVLVEEGGDLLPGMNVSADILVEQVADVLTVPVAAVGRGNTVQVLPADGYDKDGNVDPTKLETVTVELGRNDQDYIEVLSGLEEGDTVVTVTMATNIMETMMNMNGGGMGGGLPMGPGM